jgi:hypothetical protein
VVPFVRGGRKPGPIARVGGALHSLSYVCTHRSCSLSPGDLEAIELGCEGQVLRWVNEGGSFWTVMLDPAGNEFCVLRGPGDDPPRERLS